MDVSIECLYYKITVTFSPSVCKIRCHISV